MSESKSAQIIPFRPRERERIPVAEMAGIMYEDGGSVQTLRGSCRFDTALSRHMGKGKRMSFDEAFDYTLGHEGGYVNDPRDSGGETNWGISKRAYPALNIKNLTKEVAKEIYRKDYWQAVGADKFTDTIGFQLFDFAVNSGVSAATKALQRAVGVKDDGKVGPLTISAVSRLPTQSVVMALLAERLELMALLPTWQTFGKGWARRIASNLKIAAKI